MAQVRNIVVISNDHPARLHTQLEPVKITKSAEMAITSICHGEIWNIHEGNNRVTFSYVNYPVVTLDYDDTHAVMPEIEELKTFFGETQIRPGRYKDRISVLEAIDHALQTILAIEMGDHYTSRTLVFNFNNKKTTCTIGENNAFLESFGEGTPWPLLEVTDTKSAQISNKAFDDDIEVAFLYANIVENSYINEHKSRILSMIPIQRDTGYSFHEFTNPIYIPIDVKEFNNILLEIRDMNGELTHFNPKYKTVLSLHVRTINRSA